MIMEKQKCLDLAVHTVQKLAETPAVCMAFMSVLTAGFRAILPGEGSKQLLISVMCKKKKKKLHIITMGLLRLKVAWTDLDTLRY